MSCPPTGRRVYDAPSCPPASVPPCSRARSRARTTTTESSGSSGRAISARGSTRSTRPSSATGKARSSLARKPRRWTNYIVPDPTALSWFPQALDAPAQADPPRPSGCRRDDLGAGVDASARPRRELIRHSLGRGLQGRLVARCTPPGAAPSRGSRARAANRAPFDDRDCGERVRSRPRSKQRHGVRAFTLSNGFDRTALRRRNRRADDARPRSLLARPHRLLRDRRRPAGSSSRRGRASLARRDQSSPRSGSGVRDAFRARGRGGRQRLRARGAYCRATSARSSACSDCFRASVHSAFSKRPTGCC